MQQVGDLHGPVTIAEKETTNARRQRIIRSFVLLIESLRTLAPKAALVEEICLLSVSKDNGCDYDYAKLLLQQDGSLVVSYTGDYRDHLMKEQISRPEHREAASNTESIVKQLIGDTQGKLHIWREMDVTWIEHWIENNRQFHDRLSLEAGKGITFEDAVKALETSTDAIDPVSFMTVQIFLREHGVDLGPIKDKVRHLLEKTQK